MITKVAKLINPAESVRRNQYYTFSKRLGILP